MENVYEIRLYKDENTGQCILEIKLNGRLVIFERSTFNLKLKALEKFAMLLQ